MKTLALWLLVIMSLGVTTVEEVVTSPTTFAVCKAADIATTAYVIEHGIGVESNPIVASTLAHGYIPIIALSVGLWYLLKEYNNPVATAGANVVTCGVALHNLLLIP
jgi:hypothetical protein